MFSNPQEREKGGMEGGSKDSVGVTLCWYVMCARSMCIHPVVFAKSQEESTSFYLAAAKMQRFDYSDFPLM